MGHRRAVCHRDLGGRGELPLQGADNEKPHVNLPIAVRAGIYLSMISSEGVHPDQVRGMLFRIMPSARMNSPSGTYCLDNFGHCYAKLVFHQHHLAARDQAIVDIDIDGLADTA